MFCKKCGLELSESDRTCPKCGTLIDDKFATEEYDPLLALDKVEKREGDVIWQEAPLGDDAIILNAENIENSTEPLIKEQGVTNSFAEESAQTIGKEDKDFKESMAQGLRAAKSTIAHPIKPRKRIKPKTEPPKPVASQVVETPIEEVTVTESAQNVEPIVEEVTAVEETVPVEETPIVEEIIEKPIVEEVVEEIPITEEIIDSGVDDDDLMDIFDDFVVDDSIAILDETPEIIEEVPEVEETTEVIEEVEAPKETVVEEAPVVEEVPEETVVEEVPVVEEVFEETVVEEAPVIEEVSEEPVVVEEVVSIQEEIVEEVPVVEEPVSEPVVDKGVTPEEALFEENFFEENFFEEEPVAEETEFELIADEPIETPIMEEVQTKLEEIAKNEEKLETSEKLDTVKETTTDKKDIDSDVALAGAAVAGAAVAGAAARAKQSTTQKVEETSDDTILKSIDDTTLHKEKLSAVEDDRDLAIKSKFNASFSDEDYEDIDVDENINSLTSKITTVLIILLILIIAIVVATFLLQQIGL